MDGIFGVGVAEVFLIGLVLFIIGGPENTAKWARELGRWVRKGREAWSDVMAQLENELGDDGKEIVDAAREVGQEVRELRSMTSTRGMMRSALDSDLMNVPASKPATSTKNPDKPEETSASTATAANGTVDSAEKADNTVSEPVRAARSVYTAWMPPDNTPE